MTSRNPTIMSRRASPSQVLQQAWQALQGHGCILCRTTPAIAGGVYFPGPTAPPGLPPGKSFAYLLCGQCFALPKETITQRVETLVAADLRRPDVSRSTQAPSIPDTLPLDRLGWKVICGVLEVPAAVEDRVWKALTRTTSSAVQTLRYNLAWLSAEPSHARSAAVLAGALEPRTFVSVLESLVEQKRLQRSDATALEEAIFEHMGAETWR